MDRRSEKAVSVRVLRPFVIDVTFDDGYRREVDIEPLLWGEVFAPLHDVALFRQAAVDREGRSVFWPTAADLAPEFLYFGQDTPYGRIEFERPEELAVGHLTLGRRLIEAALDILREKILHARRRSITAACS